MKTIVSSIVLLLLATGTFSQTKKTELYDLVKIFIQDTSEYETVGDWSAIESDAKTVKWTSDHLEMSDDMKINFFMNGLVMITLNGSTYTQGNKLVKWNLMLRGPRAGYTNFNLTSPVLPLMKPKVSLDSLLGKNPYTKTLLKSCDDDPANGFYYFKIKLPQKVTSWIKVAWTCNTGGCKVSIDCYDDWSKQYADLICR